MLMHDQQVAFLLRVDGSTTLLEVPRDPVHGRFVQPGSFGWRLFLEDKLGVMFDGRRLTDGDWHRANVLRLPSETWLIKEREAQPQGVDIPNLGVLAKEELKVKVYHRPYVEDYLRDPRNKNQTANLFSMANYWYGDLLLVCYKQDWRIDGQVLTEIVSPSEIINQLSKEVDGFEVRREPDDTLDLRALFGVMKELWNYDSEELEDEDEDEDEDPEDPEDP